MVVQWTVLPVTVPQSDSASESRHQSFSKRRSVWASLRSVNQWTAARESGVKLPERVEIRASLRAFGVRLIAALPGELEEHLHRELRDARVVDDGGGTHVLRSGAGDLSEPVRRAWA